MSAVRVTAALALVGVVACSRSENARSDTAGTQAPAVQPTASPPASLATGGAMSMGGMHSDSVAARVEADLAALQAASPDSAVKLVQSHRQAVEALVADCERMMRQMKMTPPAKWTHEVKALRQDLIRMGSPDASGLHGMLPAHAERVREMLAMRHDMMRM